MFRDLRKKYKSFLKYETLAENLDNQKYAVPV